MTLVMAEGNDAMPTTHLQLPAAAAASVVSVSGHLRLSPV